MQFLIDATNATSVEIIGFSNGSIIVDFILTFLVSEGKTVVSITDDLVAADSATSDIDLLADSIIVIGVFINLRFLYLLRTCFY